jgi:hypothetical protein
MIMRPKQSWFYPERTDDCIAAIEARFTELISALRGSFIDAEAISPVLVSEATRSGWAQHEVTDAIGALSGRYRMVVAAEQSDVSTPF